MKYGETLVRLRAPLVTGPYNKPERDWPNAARTTIRGSVQPLSSSEDVVRQQRTETRWRVHTFPQPDGIEPTDRFEWRGRTLEVEGEVEEHTRGGRIDHLEFVLSRVTQR